jgi:hypothetical protein
MKIHHQSPRIRFLDLPGFRADHLHSVVSGSSITVSPFERGCNEEKGQEDMLVTFTYLFETSVGVTVHGSVLIIGVSWFSG